MFLEDGKQLGGLAWSDNTVIVNTVPMYAAAGIKVTADTIEQSQGYIVVSAYADVPSIILEWSDAAAPVYEELALEQGDTVVYLGGLSYLKYEGTQLTTADGMQVSQYTTVNALEALRDIKHVSTDLLQDIASSKESFPLFRADSNICVPVALTNLICTYYKRQNPYLSESDILTTFTRIMNLGMNDGLYTSAGISHDKVQKYIRWSMELFGLSYTFEIS